MPKKCSECGSTHARLDPIKNSLGATMKYRCISRSPCKKRQLDRKEKKKELTGIVKQAVRRDRDYLVKENNLLVQHNVALHVRIAELEGALLPIVRRSLRHVLPMKDRDPDTMVMLSLRKTHLTQAREALASGPAKFDENDPDFTTIARHTIEDLDKDLLVIDTLANEFMIAYEAGYEHRRSLELAILRGDQNAIDFERTS